MVMPARLCEYTVDIYHDKALGCWTELLLGVLEDNTYKDNKDSVSLWLT